MNALQRILSSLTAATLLAASGAHAHHSWSTHYDLSQSKRVVGTVARVIFQSPHSAILLDVARPDGREERWRIEWASPARLRERGIDSATIRAGDALAVNGNPHRDADTRSLRAESLRRLSDGREL